MILDFYEIGLARTANEVEPYPRKELMIHIRVLSVNNIIIIIFMTTQQASSITQMSAVIFLCGHLLTIGCQSAKHTSIDLSQKPSTAELFAEDIITTSLYERDIAITPDGQEIIYTIGDHKQSRRCLVSIKFIDNEWSTPEILNISGKYQDIEPFFTEGGNRLFFASNRPINENQESKDYDIWYSDRGTTGWDKPVRLNENINTPQNEFYPSISASGNLYFTATREDGIGTEDLFISYLKNGEYGHPQVLDSTINTSFYEFNAYIHPDENLIIFSSYGRDDDMGGGDLYYSTKDKDGMWLPSQNMGPSVNSTSLDYCPFVDVQRDNFYFTSERRLADSDVIESYEQLRDQSNGPLNGFGNIYRINYKQLNIGH